MQINQLWTNFPEIILAFDVSTCIKIIISRKGFPEINLVMASLYVDFSDSLLAGDQKVIRY